MSQAFEVLNEDSQLPESGIARGFFFDFFRGCACKIEQHTTSMTRCQIGPNEKREGMDGE